MSSDSNTSPIPSLELLPEHGERSKRRKISPLVQNDGHDTVKITKRADANTSPFALLALPAELHLCIIDHLPFWDVYALRLTCRHFASITPPFSGCGDNDQKFSAKFQLLLNRREAEGGDVIGLCGSFNRSWLARKYNRAYHYCTRDGCDFGNCGWSYQPFPIMALPTALQLRIIGHLQFYTIDALRNTCRHFAAMIPLIGKMKDEFEALYNETAAAGGNIDEMCDNFNLSWFAISWDVAYDSSFEPNKECGCHCDPAGGYSDGWRFYGCKECGWEESQYDDYNSWTLKY